MSLLASEWKVSQSPVQPRAQFATENSHRCPSSSLLLGRGRSGYSGRGGLVVLDPEALLKVVALVGLALVATLASLLHLGAACLRLVTEHLGARVLCLLLVNVLHEDTLVLEDVTLALHVQVVVQVFVDLLRLAVAHQQATQDTHAPDPDDLLRHTCIGRTLSLARPCVATLAPSLGILPHARARVHSHRLADDQAVLDELANVLTRVSVGDLIRLVWVEPDLVFAAFQHLCGESLLRP